LSRARSRWHRMPISVNRLAIVVLGGPPTISADIACQDGEVGLRNLMVRPWFLTPGRRIIRLVRAEMMAYARIPCHWQPWIGEVGTCPGADPSRRAGY
jgi:hypothetical protein